MTCRRAFRPGAPPKLQGRLHGMRILQIFDTAVVSGTLCHGTDCRHFLAVVRCIDGDATQPVRVMWTDSGGVRVATSELARALALPKWHNGLSETQNRETTGHG